MIAQPWRIAADGVDLAVRATPRARRPGLGPVIVGADGVPLLGARVAAPAENGRANDAIRALIADSLGVSVSRVEIVSGHCARIKRFAVWGDPERLAVRLRELACLGAQDASVSIGPDPRS